jgi:hypothetical protein
MPRLAVPRCVLALRELVATAAEPPAHCDALIAQLLAIIPEAPPAYQLEFLDLLCALLERYDHLNEEIASHIAPLVLALLDGDRECQGAGVRCFASLVRICPRSTACDIPRMVEAVGAMLFDADDCLIGACCGCIGTIAASQADALQPFLGQIVAALEGGMRRRHRPSDDDESAERRYAD